jgi:hypothetical protein
MGNMMTRPRVLLVNLCELLAIKAIRQCDQRRPKPSVNQRYLSAMSRHTRMSGDALSSLSTAKI